MSVSRDHLVDMIGSTAPGEMIDLNIAISGCDDTTEFTFACHLGAAVWIAEMAERSQAESEYNCQPRIIVRSAKLQ
ncbi:hypothetical protein HOT75_gp049 [Gordonia phage Daredevil]|uniref:Uncharacterized protein n=1 Tax=Gordonia phage Daredevil TaxID=2283286 RepID=A0A345MIQ5_9CAUD|nr:hypothetical protein HOT75_gp049 [Gordonia phage Daredevil]AXH70436.1 hypothetical protein SEA_DAREDEVIL_49 [Gordonia phage Daredevil]